MRNRMELIVNATETEIRQQLDAMGILNGTGLHFDDIDNETLKQISSLSERNKGRLKTLNSNLQDMGLLSVDTLKQALARVTASIPNVPAASVVKTKNTRRSEHQLGQTKFFLNHGASRHKDAAGGQASINKGYASPGDNNPSVAVKRLNQPDDNYSQARKKVAQREAKYLNFLDRHSTWYKGKNYPIIVSDWQNGESIDDLNEANVIDFSTFSISQRLQWLACGLMEVDKLHAHFRLHGDLKPGNFILDTVKHTLRLIDFGATQKVNSAKSFPATAMFVDMKEGKPRKTASDMFAMGYIVTVLFPELFDLAAFGRKFVLCTPDGGMQIFMQAEPPYRVKKKNKDSLSNSETAVIALLDACMEENAEDRCTSQQALLFCNNLAAMLSIKPDIDAKELESVLTSSINRNVYEVEDALRGSKRPAKFGAVKAVKPEPKSVVTATMYAPKKDVAAKATNDNDNNKCVLM